MASKSGGVSAGRARMGRIDARNERLIQTLSNPASSPSQFSRSLRAGSQQLSINRAGEAFNALGRARDNATGRQRELLTNRMNRMANTFSPGNARSSRPLIPFDIRGISVTGLRVGNRVF